MPSENEPILTKTEIEHERKVLAEMDAKFGDLLGMECHIKKLTSALNTITQAVELLRILTDNMAFQKQDELKEYVGIDEYPPPVVVVKGLDMPVKYILVCQAFLARYDGEK